MFVINPYHFLDGMRWDPTTSHFKVAISNSERNAQRSTAGSPDSVLSWSRFPKSTGSWYVEVKLETAATGGATIGLAVGDTAFANEATAVNVSGNYLLYKCNGQAFQGPTYLGSSGSNWATGDILGVRLNASTGAISMYKNNTAIWTATLAKNGFPFVLMGWFQGENNIPFRILTEPELVYGVPSGYTYWSPVSDAAAPAAWNPASVTSSVITVVGPSNYTANAGTSDAGGLRSVKSVTSSTGKWYIEYNASGGGNFNASVPFIGVSTSWAALNGAGGIGTGSWGILGNGNKWNNNISSGYGSLAQGLIMFAHDPATGKWWAGKDGTWFGGGNPAAGTGEGGTTTTVEALYLSWMFQSGWGGSISIRQENVYTIPTGFTAFALV